MPHTLDTLAVDVHHLSLRGPRGWVYRDVALQAAPGDLVAVQGEAGSGRTSLLLTLAGRMIPTSGIARIGNYLVPNQLRAVQRIAGLALVPGVTDLDPHLTVADHIRERLLLRGRLPRRARVAQTLAAVFTPGTTPGAAADPASGTAGRAPAPHTLARDLDPAQRQLLGVALALVDDPFLVLVDDVDAGLPAARQRALWQALRRVAERGVTVLATCRDAQPAAGIAGQVVRLDRQEDHRARI